MLFFSEGFTFRNFLADAFAVFMFVLWFWLLIVVIGLEAPTRVGSADAVEETTRLIEIRGKNVDLGGGLLSASGLIDPGHGGRVSRAVRVSWVEVAVGGGVCAGRAC